MDYGLGYFGTNSNMLNCPNDMSGTCSVCTTPYGPELPHMDYPQRPPVVQALAPSTSMQMLVNSSIQQHTLASSQPMMAPPPTAPGGEGVL